MFMKYSLVIVGIICVLLCTSFAVVQSGMVDVPAAKKNPLCCRKAATGGEAQDRTATRDTYLLMNGIFGYQ